MKKVNFKKVTILNFLSVGEEPVTVEFKKGLHVITGINRDKPDRRNAIGKSTIADSIYFAIFGDTLREIKKDLIPNNITGGGTHVELDFEVNTPKGTNSYKIVRQLGPSKVYVYKNGVDKTRDSIANTNKYICDVTSATPSIFQNCVIMTVNNAVPFMAKNKIEKRKFIEDIFGMEVFSQMLSTLRAEYNEIKREHDLEITKLTEVSSTHKSYNDQKESILKRRQEKKKLYNQRQKDNTAELQKLQKQLEDFKEEDTSALRKAIDAYNEKLTVCEEKINGYIEEISTEKAKVKHTKESYTKVGTAEDTCPVCLRGILEHDAEYIEREKESLKQEIVKMVEEIKVINESLEKAKNVKLKIQQDINTNNNRLSEAKVNKQKREGITHRIEQLNKWQEELNEDLKAIEGTDTDFDELITATKTRLKELETKVQKYRKEIAKLDIVKYVVSEEGVKSYIVNKLLELLNNKLLQYLRKLDSNSICIFNEYFEEEILNEKNKVCSYFNFSGAERKSIDLACLFTFSDIRRMQGGVQYNIAIYDELFDSSFDEKGIELITQILQDRVEELDECSIVISHRKESIKAVTGEVVYLEKSNGITRRVDYTDI